MFVALKSGIVDVFDSVNDPTPTVYAGLRTEVADFWDRGLLGLALDPRVDEGRPYVYVLYTYNKDPSSTTYPRWPDDSCPRRRARTATAASSPGGSREWTRTATRRC